VLLNYNSTTEAITYVSFAILAGQPFVNFVRFNCSVIAINTAKSMAFLTYIYPIFCQVMISFLSGRFTIQAEALMDFFIKTFPFAPIMVTELFSKANITLTSVVSVLGINPRAPIVFTCYSLTTDTICSMSCSVFIVPDVYIIVFLSDSPTATRTFMAVGCSVICPFTPSVSATFSSTADFTLVLVL
jgi:hypothetical protein